jgi:hypothetical protein
MTKDYTVLIIDFEKLPNELWKKLWHDKTILYAGKIAEDSYSRVTDAVDKIQEDELEKEVL